MFKCCICGKDADYGQVLFATDGSGRKYCYSCKNAFAEMRKKESEQHRKELRALWYQEHKEEIAEKRKERRTYNAENNRKWKASHREQINQHEKERKQLDPVYKLKHQARNTIYHSFSRTGNAKSERCEKIVGLPIDDFVFYLKGTYREIYGKDWDGVEKVHIDHIIPLAAAATEKDVLRLCHYTNLRLITAEDNQRKGAKLNYAI
jgi:hypothetical protein